LDGLPRTREVLNIWAGYKPAHITHRYKVERRDNVMKAIANITLIGTFISLIVLTLLLIADDSFARGRDRRYVAPRNTHNERVIVRQRARHSDERVARRKFINKRRAYYRPYWRGYDGRRARVVYGRPYGYWRPWPRNSAYFSLSGIFYQSPPTRYVVVKTPPETVVIRETTTIVRPVESARGNVLVTVSTLNVRTGPDLGYSLVSQVKEGSILELHGKTNDWSYVRLRDGRFGWVTSVFTEQVKPGNG
jgi:hypothetical protein